MFSNCMTSVCCDCCHISTGIIFFLHLIQCQAVILAKDKCEIGASENTNLTIAVIKLWMHGKASLSVAKCLCV